MNNSHTGQKTKLCACTGKCSCGITYSGNIHDKCMMLDILY